MALEGLDGSGKTTVAERICAALGERGREVLLTREPGGTAIGEQIRSVLLGGAGSGMLPATEALLFAASRAQHVGEVIRPALARGAVVVSDRFTDSSLAYQWGGRGLPLDEVRSIQNLAIDGLEPDIKLLFDLPEDVALDRRRSAEGEPNRLDQEELAFYSRVRSSYFSLVADDPRRWRIIDASQSTDDVWAQVRTALAEHDLVPVPNRARQIEANVTP